MSVIHSTSPRERHILLCIYVYKKVLEEISTSRDPECLIYNNINEIFFHSDWNERTAVFR